ncbi:MAG: hypothetical protein VYC12_06080, partial [Candidatus Thermoplasmatota archaeon]|nr:hypothetical protein [Candidatus Thermoplasmatota archaeon]
NSGTNSGIYDGFCQDPEDIIFGNKLYFAAYTSTRGSELFTYNFADNTTTALPEVRPGTSSGVYSDCVVMPTPLHMEEFDGQIYFRGDNGNTGSELYRYNPVDNIIEMVEDYNPTGTGNRVYSMGTMIAYDDTLIWRCFNDSHGSELCRLGTSTDITYSE